MSEYCNNIGNMTISEVVKFIRNTKSMSLEQLGDMFGVSKSAAWVCGMRTLCTIAQQRLEPIIRRSNNSKRNTPYV